MIKTVWCNRKLRLQKFFRACDKSIFVLFAEQYMIVDSQNNAWFYPTDNCDKINLIKGLMLNKVSISDHIIIIADVHHLNENNILSRSLYFIRPTTRKEFCEDKGIEIIVMFTGKRLHLTHLLFLLGAGNILSFDLV